MNEHMYSHGWKNVEQDCQLCHMDRLTEWHIETPRFVIAETLSGGPFIVSKKHETQLSDERLCAAEHLVSLLYGDAASITVMMNLVEDHWHGHIYE